MKTHQQSTLIHSSFRYLSFKTPDVDGLHQAFIFDLTHEKNVNTARSDEKRKTALEIIPVQFFFIYSVLRILLSCTYSRYFLPVLSEYISLHTKKSADVTPHS